MAGEHSFPPCHGSVLAGRRRVAVTLAGAERRERRREGAKDDGLSLAFGANSGAGDPPPSPVRRRLASSCSAFFKKGGVFVVCRIFGIFERCDV